MERRTGSPMPVRRCEFSSSRRARIEFSGPLGGRRAARATAIVSMPSTALGQRVPRKAGTGLSAWLNNLATHRLPGRRKIQLPLGTARVDCHKTSYRFQVFVSTKLVVLHFFYFFILCLLPKLN